MPKREKYHVTHEENKWKVQKEASQRPAKTFDNKQDAFNFGREIAKNQPLGQLIIHKKSGIIQEERTYRKDPFPPRG